MWIISMNLKNFLVTLKSSLEVLCKNLLSKDAFDDKVLQTLHFTEEFHDSKQQESMKQEKLTSN